TLLADACQARGLVLPPLAAATLDALRDVLAPTARLANPLDPPAAATPEHYEPSIRAPGAAPAAGALAVLYGPPMGTRRGAAAVPAEKPVLAVFLSTRGAPSLLGSGPRGAIPSYSFPENAAEALAAAVRWGRWRQRAPGVPLSLGRFARDAIRAVVERVLAGADGPIWLEPEDLATVLRAAGIEFAEIVRTTREGAVAAAHRIGFPLVAKAIAPELLLRRDVDGVE